jgi:hypothetical protein
MRQSSAARPHTPPEELSVVTQPPSPHSNPASGQSIARAQLPSLRSTHVAIKAALNPNAEPFTPKAAAEHSVFSATATHSRARRDWADLDSDEAASDVDDTASETSAGDRVAAGQLDAEKAAGTAAAVASLSDALTHSLLIQSFGGLSHAGSSASASERLSPDSHDSPAPVVQQQPPQHNTTVGFSLCQIPEASVPVLRSRDAPVSGSSNHANLRVSVPIDSRTPHRHGYAGLLGHAKASVDSGAANALEPALEPVDSVEDDEKVCSPSWSLLLTLVANA